MRINTLPDARHYIVSGLEAAEQTLARRDDIASRITFVEHGDAVREALSGVTVTEGNGRLKVQRCRRGAFEKLLRLYRVMRQVRLVVGVTRRTELRARTAGARRFQWIPNAVPPPVHSVTAAPSARVGFVGRLTRVKGLDRYLELADRVDVPAFVAGLPTDELDERVMQSHCVSWHIAPPDPWKLGMRVLAMPSRLEASPFSALEAESRGIPVVISDASQLSPSPLITRLPWSRETWAHQVEQLARRPVDIALGRRIACERWKHFVAAWRRITKLPHHQDGDIRLCAS